MGKIKAWFWSPTRPDENSAQTVFRVLGNFARWAATFVFFASILIAIQIISEQTSEKKLSKLREKVHIVKVEHSSECDADFPIIVLAGNLSNKTVEAFDVEIEARRQGRSTNLLDYSNKTLNWDLIIPPGEGYKMCYKFPSISDKYDLKELEWSGTIRAYSIKFREN